MKKVFLSFLFSMGLSWGMEASQPEPYNLLSVSFDVFHAHIAPCLTWRDYIATRISCQHFSKELKGEGQVVELEYNKDGSKPTLEKYISYLNQYPMAKGVQFKNIFWGIEYPEKFREEFASALLTPLKTMTNIKDLILIDFAVSNEILNKIVESAPNLQKLFIQGNIIADTLNSSPLKLGVLLKLPHLKALLFNQTQIDQALRFDTEQLTSLLRENNLEELSLVSSHLNENIVNILGTLSKLTNLEVLLPPGKAEKDDQVWRDLYYFPLYSLPIPTPPNLKRLVVKLMAFNEKSITSLFQLIGLEALGLTDNNRSYYDDKGSLYNNTQSFNQMVSRLNAFPSLTSLDFSHSFFNSDSVSSLKKLTNLKRLKLDHCTNIKAGELTPLSGHLNLEALSLRETAINADDLQAICKLVNLVNLNVAGCKNLTSADFLSLVNLRNLQILNLAATRANDDVIEQLLPQLPNLTVLTFSIAKDWGLSCKERELLEKRRAKEIKNKYPNLQIRISDY